MNAYTADDQDALRAYHLHRVTSQFTTTISAESARRLARLLEMDDEADGTLRE